MDGRFKEGNKDAEKWTEEATISILKDMAEFTIENEAYSLSTLLQKHRLYNDWWVYISEKFKNNDTVFRIIKGIETSIESNIINNTMDGTAKSGAMAIFLLKNRYGYKDKTETDITTGGESFNIKDLIKFE